MYMSIITPYIILETNERISHHLCYLKRRSKSRVLRILSSYSKLFTFATEIRSVNFMTYQVSQSFI